MNYIEIIIKLLNNLQIEKCDLSAEELIEMFEFLRKECSYIEFQTILINSISGYLDDSYNGTYCDDYSFSEKDVDEMDAKQLIIKNY